MPAPAKFDAVRAEARASLIGVANALTGAEYDDNAFVVITSGRCEYRNKGIDIYIDMADTLRHLEACRKVIAYVMVPAWPKEARADLRARLDSQAMAEGALDEPVVTHWLNNPDSDMVAGRIRSLGFCNIDSRVSVIYVPCYLNGTDGIFGRDYYDLLIGADATVFPLVLRAVGLYPARECGVWRSDSHDVALRFPDSGCLNRLRTTLKSVESMSSDAVTPTIMTWSTI